MKAELINLFNQSPAIAAKGPAFADDLAEDVQAVIIRALGLHPGDPQLTELEHAVDDAYVSPFGVTLSNLLFMEYSLTGAEQKAATKAMLQTLLLDGAILKTRLRNMAAVV